MNKGGVTSYTLILSKEFTLPTAADSWMVDARILMLIPQNPLWSQGIHFKVKGKLY